MLVVSKFNKYTIIHPWCDDHSTNISIYGAWGARAEIQVFKKELHTYIHLAKAIIEFLSCIKKFLKKISISARHVNKK